MSGHTTTTQCAASATTVANLSVPRVSSRRLSPSCRLSLSLSPSLFLPWISINNNNNTLVDEMIAAGTSLNHAVEQSSFYMGIREKSPSVTRSFSPSFSPRFPGKEFIPAPSVTHSPFCGYRVTRKIFHEVARLTGPPRMQPPPRISRDISVLVSLLPVFLARCVDSAVADYHARRPELRSNLQCKN